jgi:hypothetical protein
MLVVGRDRLLGGERCRPVPHGGRRRRGGLSVDTLAWIRLDAAVDRLAIAISRGEVDYPAAVAELALIVPARPDLVDYVIATTGKANRLNWPPVDIRHELLAQTRRVTTGEVPLAGPGGVRVVHTATAGDDGSRRCRLQVRAANGDLVAEVTDAGQLTRYLDPGRLVPISPPGTGHSH